MFLIIEISSKDKWSETLEETPTEDMDKISEWYHDKVSPFMESEIDHMEEIHRFIVEYSEGEIFQGIDREDDEE